MNTSLHTHRDTTVPSKVRPADVYGVLRQRLMNGEFSLRTRLVEERLAVELGVSRTPVREALRRLLSDSLVVREGSGYFVAVPDLVSLRNLYELRMTLELHGIMRAGHNREFRHDRAVLEQLHSEWDELRVDMPEPTSDFVVMDEDFHLTLLGSSGNDVLTQTLESVNARIRPIRMYDYLTAERIETTIVEHLTIVERVLDGEYVAAADLLRHHIATSMDHVEQRAAHALSQMTLMRGGVS